MFTDPNVCAFHLLWSSILMAFSQLFVTCPDKSVRQQIWRFALAHFSWNCADHTQLNPAQSSSQAGCFVLYGMWISVRLLMQIMPHQHVYTLLKINVHALYTSWDNFMSLLLVIFTWILMSWQFTGPNESPPRLYCTVQGLNLTLLCTVSPTTYTLCELTGNGTGKFLFLTCILNICPQKNISDPCKCGTSQSVRCLCSFNSGLGFNILWYIFVNYNWVVTRWQQYNTHLHTNNTQNDKKQTIHRTTQQFRKSAGSAPSWLFIPWHLPYNRGKSTETQGQCAKNSFIFM
jgi:hypothetical protein